MARTEEQRKRAKERRALRRQQHNEPTSFWKPGDVERVELPSDYSAPCELCGTMVDLNDDPESNSGRMTSTELKVLGRLLCVWCHTRRGKRLVQFKLLGEKLAQQPCEGREGETCKCLPCVARRVVEASIGDQQYPPRKFSK